MQSQERLDLLLKRWQMASWGDLSPDVDQSVKRLLSIVRCSSSGCMHRWWSQRCLRGFRSGQHEALCNGVEPPASSSKSAPLLDPLKCAKVPTYCFVITCFVVVFITLVSNIFLNIIIPEVNFSHGDTSLFCICNFFLAFCISKRRSQLRVWRHDQTECGRFTKLGVASWLTALSSNDGMWGACTCTL